MPLIKKTTRLMLTVAINYDGTCTQGWFRVRSIHRSKRVARQRAVAFRKRGYLARVRGFSNHWLVATRKPRKREPAVNHLEV